MFGFEVQIQKWTATEKEFQIAPGDAENARISVFYHPNWQAEVNGIPSVIAPDENGASLVSILSQNSFVRITFQETFWVQTGRWLAAITWFFVVVLLVIQPRYKFSEKCS